MMRVCHKLPFVVAIGISIFSPPLLMRAPANVNQAFPILLTAEMVSGQITDDGSDSIRLTLKLKFVLKNAGSEPILTLRRDPELVERELIDPSDQTKRLVRVSSYRSIERTQEWKTLRKRLNKRSLPSDVIRSLSPGETLTWETIDWFQISKSNGINFSNKSWKEVLAASPVTLLLTVELWPRNVELQPGSDQLRLGKLLQHRWQKSGTLLLTTVTSEPLQLDLSSLPTTIKYKN